MEIKRTRVKLKNKFTQEDERSSCGGVTETIIKYIFYVKKVLKNEFFISCV